VSARVDSLRNHPFLKDLQIQTVTFREFRETEYCKKISQDTQAAEMLDLYQNGKAIVATAITNRESIDAAVVITKPDADERTIIHEFGHIRVAKMSSGLKLRRAYERKRALLQSIVKEQWPFTRHLIERTILFPEECEIEHQILESCSDKTARERYLEDAYNKIHEGLVETEQAEKSGSFSKRVQAGLHRFNYTLVCRWFGRISEGYDLGELAQRFRHLSDEFAKTTDLSGIRFDQLWNLVENGSMKAWVDQSMSAMKQVVGKRTPHKLATRKRLSATHPS
jgi:hypothetical protein